MPLGGMVLASPFPWRRCFVRRPSIAPLRVRDLAKVRPSTSTRASTANGRAVASPRPDRGCIPGGRSGTRPPSSGSRATNPPPEFAAQVAEQHQRFLDLLDNETLRKVAVWKL